MIVMKKKIMLSKFEPPPFFFLLLSNICQLLQTLYNQFTKFLSWVRIRIEQAAGPH